MKKNFNVPCLDACGVQAKDDDGRAIRIADIAITALTSPIQGDDLLTSTEKISLCSLAIRIGEATKAGAPDGGLREFSKEELVTIKTRAAKNCRILPFGRLCEVIDSDEAKPEKSE